MSSASICATIVLAVCFLLFGCVNSQNSESASQAMVYAIPGSENLQKSTLYDVSVDGQVAPVLESTPPTERLCFSRGCDGADKARDNKRSQAWAQFSFAQQARVSVKKTRVAGNLADIKIRPSADEGKAYRVLSKNLERAEIVIDVLQPNAKLSVEFIDDRFHPVRQVPFDSLMIFGDQLETEDRVPPPTKVGAYAVKYGEAFDREMAKTAKTVIFEPGVHELGYWEIPESVMHVYLAGGAYVKGAMNSALPHKRFQKGFTVSGRGTISGEAFPWRADKRQQGLKPCLSEKGEAVDCWFNTVKLLQVGTDKYHLEGIIFVNAPSYVITGFKDDNIAWNGNDGEGTDVAANDPLGAKLFSEENNYSGMMSNFKVLGNWRWNNDGAAIHANSTIKDCFISAFDDAFKTYSTAGKVRDCVIWQADNGAVFQFGWYAKNIANLDVKNLKVIHAEQTGLNQNTGIINFADRGYHREDKAKRYALENSVFKNIRVEGPLTRIVGLENEQVQNQSFRNLRFENIVVDYLVPADELQAYARLGNGASKPGQLDWRGLPVTRPANMINDSGKDAEIQNLVFKNLIIGGKKITKDNAKTLGQFTIIGAENEVFFE